MREKRYQVIPRTVCLVFDEHNKLLLIRFSAKKGTMAGYSNPPGGHIEEGEGIIENAHREIKEEAGLEVTATKLRGVIHAINFFGKDAVMLFITSSLAAGGKLRASEEGEPYWTETKGLNDIKVFDDMKYILEKVRGPHESDIFTAKSEFDKNGKMIHFEFEDYNS